MPKIDEHMHVLMLQLQRNGDRYTASKVKAKAGIQKGGRRGRNDGK